MNSRSSLSVVLVVGVLSLSSMFHYMLSHNEQSSFNCCFLKLAHHEALSVAESGGTQQEEGAGLACSAQILQGGAAEGMWASWVVLPQPMCQSSCVFGDLEAFSWQYLSMVLWRWKRVVEGFLPFAVPHPLYRPSQDLCLIPGLPAGSH